MRKDGLPPRIRDKSPIYIVVQSVLYNYVMLTILACLLQSYMYLIMMHHTIV